ncbi:MAG: DEAD/DEAH box helicase [Candidatus Bilamarchaeaceae archaeon]
MTEFSQMSLSEKTLKSLERMGYAKPTEVQERVIPLMLMGENLIVRSKTGTGKTAAFGIGLIERLVAEPGKKALVLAPTRELALQIYKEVGAIAKEHPIYLAVVYGGAGMEPQVQALRKRPEIIIATPGRLLDHAERGTVNLSEYGIVVLDEADRMLDMGFKDEMDRVMRQIPEERNVLLFSATVDEQILELVSEYMRGPAETVEIGEKEKVETISEDFVQVSRREKFSKLKEILRAQGDGRVLIFMATKRGVDFLHGKLLNNGFRAEGIHGDLSQARRERALESFRSGKSNILVASDVAARGIHVEDIGLIVNYDEAQDADTHLHRVGRTGRMGKEGRAITFVESIEAEQSEDRNRPDHPDFAWMREGGSEGSAPRKEHYHRDGHSRKPPWKRTQWNVRSRPHRAGRPRDVRGHSKKSWHK